MTDEIADLKSALEIAQRDLVEKAVQASTQQVYIREVSTFHREALLPLLDIMSKLLGQLTSSPAHAEHLAKVKAFVKTVADRSKFYESQALVERARQAAIDEHQRLSLSKTL